MDRLDDAQALSLVKRLFAEHGIRKPEEMRGSIRREIERHLEYMGFITTDVLGSGFIKKVGRMVSLLGGGGDAHVIKKLSFFGRDGETNEESTIFVTSFGPLTPYRIGADPYYSMIRACEPGKRSIENSVLVFEAEGYGSYGLVSPFDKAQRFFREVRKAYRETENPSTILNVEAAIKSAVNYSGQVA